jgi:hypothetical protein
VRQRALTPWPWWADVLALVAVAGGLFWAVTTGERELTGYLAMGAWALLLVLVMPWTHPATPSWGLALVAAGCAAAAVGFFRLYQWAGWPVMAYLDAVTFGLFALLAVLALWLKWRSPGGQARAAGAAGASRGEGDSAARAGGV